MTHSYAQLKTEHLSVHSATVKYEGLNYEKNASTS